MVKKFELQCIEKSLEEERDLIIAFGCRFNARSEITPRNSDGALNSRQTCSRAKQWETIEIVCDTRVDRPGIYGAVGAFRGLCSNTTKTLQAPQYCSSAGVDAWELPVLNIYNVFLNLNIFAIQSLCKDSPPIISLNNFEFKR